jgi:hypothetical protein
MTGLVQRWRERRDLYRPAGEVIQPSRYDVEPLDEATAKAFVVAHHYSGSYPAARFRFGLYDRGELAGVAVFSHPCRDEVLTRVFAGEATDSVELGRFVLLDEVPGNGESWFLARAFERLRGHVRGILSFSDPMPRERADGTLVTPGHVGTIYQASNGIYLGRGQRRTLRLLPDGRVFSARAASKIRALERGWKHASALLEEFGAPPLDQDAPAQWLATWLPRLTKTVRHPGHHLYAWALERRVRPRLVSAGPYPKKLAA